MAAVVAPSATVAVAGTDSRPVDDDVSVNVVPPPGAGDGSVIVAVVARQPMVVDCGNVNDCAWTSDEVDRARRTNNLFMAVLTGSR